MGRLWHREVGRICRECTRVVADGREYRMQFSPLCASNSEQLEQCYLLGHPMDENLPKRTNDLPEIADELTWYEPADPTPRHQCPCCDYVTLPERGNYLICPVCFWEDDYTDVDNLDSHSGPNHLTLRLARKNFRQFGACQSRLLEHVVPDEGRAQFEYLPRSL